MGWFSRKSKEEKEFEAQMQRDEQIEIFNESINSLKAKREEFAKIAAEAEVNGDIGTFDIACNALIDLNDNISCLTQTKANFEIMNISNSITGHLVSAMKALDNMANNGVNLPNIAEIQKTNLKVAKYMKKVTWSKNLLSKSMKTTNPANKTRTSEEIASIRPMIDAARSKMTISGIPQVNASNLDISADIEKAKNKIN